MVRKRDIKIERKMVNSKIARLACRRHNTVYNLPIFHGAGLENFKDLLESLKWLENLSVFNKNLDFKFSKAH